jgi:2-polyprenyl-3-methyl-5-hydroxy-6-metoxy-1,4-benzoquinol methylase
MTSLNIHKCPICQYKSQFTNVINLNNVPTNQNIVYKNNIDAKNCQKHNINLILCHNCGLIFNNVFDENLINYSKSYENSVMHSKYYVNYINDQMIYLIKNGYLSNNSIIIDIGCGKGDYIKIFSNKLFDCSFYGFDTSYNGPLNISKKNITFFKAYYPNNNIILNPNTIINRHVIEHIADPISFLVSLRSTLDTNNYLFLETPDFNWIINNKAIFDIAYEHCNYWTRNSISTALFKTGFQIVDIKTGYEDQYLWVVAKAIENNSSCLVRPQPFEFNIDNYFSNTLDLFSRSIIKIYNSNKKIALWGASAKGCSFVNLFDQNNIYISCLIDINPKKQNCYIAKTGHKIISPSKINSLDIDFIIVMNPNYYSEILEYLKSNNLSNIEVICVGSLITI